MIDIKTLAAKTEEAYVNVADLIYRENFSPEIFDAFRAELNSQFLHLKTAMDCREWKTIEGCFPGQTEQIFKRTGQVVTSRYFPFAKFKTANKFSSYEEFYADYIKGNFVVIDALKNVSGVVPAVLKQYRDQTGYSKAITLEQFIKDADPATGKPASSLYSQCARETNLILPESVFSTAEVNKLFTLMNDNVNHQILKHSKADIPGQLRFSVNEGGGNLAYIVLLPTTGIDIPANINNFDMQILNVIGSACYYCDLNGIPATEVILTSEDIWRILNGKDNHSKVTANQNRRVIESLNKLRTTDLRLDITDEVKSENYPEINKLMGSLRKDSLDEEKAHYFFRDVMLPAEVGEKVVGKRRVDSIRLRGVPFLYAYNKAKKHLLFASPEELNVGSSAPNNAEIRNYLLIEIDKIKSGVRNNSTILFGSMYAEGIKSPEERASAPEQIRVYRGKDRNTITACLDEWKRQGKINGYKMKHDKADKQKIIGVTVLMKKKGENDFSENFQQK